MAQLFKILKGGICESKEHWFVARGFYWQSSGERLKREGFGLWRGPEDFGVQAIPLPTILW